MGTEYPDSGRASEPPPRYTPEELREYAAAMGMTLLARETPGHPEPPEVLRRGVHEWFTQVEPAWQRAIKVQATTIVGLGTAPQAWADLAITADLDPFEAFALVNAAADRLAHHLRHGVARAIERTIGDDGPAAVGAR